jgi:hypothetical protein
MTTLDFIIQLFCLVDEQIGQLPKHPQARLYPSELVTIGLLFALKGVHFRAFYRKTGATPSWLIPVSSRSWTATASN